jgi:methylenetetrahydrofolate dehydrogenase (NADP+)/methenyltetrahydrofolate cyclohydrolase
METNIIRDESLRDQILSGVKMDIIQIRETYGNVPGIAFIGFVGVPLGKYNIPFHIGQAKQMGFRVFEEIRPETITEQELFDIVDTLNGNDDVHAIVLLQPLPSHLSPIRIMNRIDPRKEVEGFHPQNILDTLMPEIRRNGYPMCLPTALAEIFNHNGIQSLKGQEWVLLLDDEFFSNQLVNMVTRTAFTMAVPSGCPLTIVNMTSERVPELTRRADFLVVVTKKPESVRPEWLKPGVFIIDIYSNLVKEITSKNDPGKLVPVIRGGVNVEAVSGIAGGIIPIPGGLMSIVLAILFRNAVQSFRNILE